MIVGRLVKQQIRRKPSIFIHISLEQKAGQNQNVKACNKPFKSVTYFKCSGTGISQKCINEEYIELR
jgi:hypothetical protein